MSLRFSCERWVGEAVWGKAVACRGAGDRAGRATGGVVAESDTGIAVGIGWTRRSVRRRFFQS
jgi:hypothetical protein